MAFKMRGKPVISGTNDHRSALQYKQKADAEYESAVAFNEKLRKAEEEGKLPEEFAAKVRKAGTKDTGDTGSGLNANMMNSPADANYGSPADANMGDSPAKVLPILANVVRAGASRFLPVVANVARTQAPKLLRNVKGGLGSLKDKAFNLVKKAAPSLISYGLGSYAGSESEKTKQRAKENVKKNQPKTENKTKTGGSGIVNIIKGATKQVRKAMNAKKAKVNPYSRAKKNDPNLDSYIRGRDKHKKGSAEYNAFQNKINAAYGVSKRHTTVTSPSAQPSKADVKKTKIQTKADKRKGEVDENVARKTTRKTYRTAKKTGTAQEAADAKVKMLEAKLADVTGAGGGRKRVLFGKLTAKNIQKKLDKARAKAGSPANFGPGKVSKKTRKIAGEKLRELKEKYSDSKVAKKAKKATTASTTRATAGVGRILKSESEKAKMKAAGVGRKN